MGTKLGALRALGVGFVAALSLACGNSDGGGTTPQGSAGKGGGDGAAGSMSGAAGALGGMAQGGGAGAGMAGGNQAGETMGGSGGGPAVTDNAFDPDVPDEYVGKVVSPGMEVVAHTIRETTLGAEFLMAVKNTGTDHLCAIDVQFAFLDAAGTELGSGFSGLDVGVERGSNGAGGFTQCLGPGKVGMLSDTLALSDVDLTKIAKITHEFGALILVDAVATDDIKVSGVQAVPGDFGGMVFSRSVDNDGPDPVKNPAVAIYGLNAVGRPLFVSEAIELTTIAAGDMWPFKTTGKFDEPYASYAAYARVSDL